MNGPSLKAILAIHFTKIVMSRVPKVRSEHLLKEEKMQNILGRVSKTGGGTFPLICEQGDASPVPSSFDTHGFCNFKGDKLIQVNISSWGPASPLVSEACWNK